MEKFVEVQKFKQIWIWAVLLGSLIFPLMGIGVLLIHTRVNSYLSFMVLFSLVATIIFVIFLLWLMKLITEIDKEGITIRFLPFVNKKIEWSLVDSCTIIDYGFIGGWGIRLTRKYGTVYNISGSKGLLLSLKNGKKILIGTQQEDELREFLDNNFD